MEMAGWSMALVFLVAFLIIFFIERSQSKMIDEGTVLLRAADAALKKREMQDQLRVLRAVRDGTFDKEIGPEHPDYCVFRQLLEAGFIEAKVIHESAESKAIH